MQALQELALPWHEGASFLLETSLTSLTSPSPAPPLILALMAFEAAENDNPGIYAEEQLGF